MSSALLAQPAAATNEPSTGSIHPGVVVTSATGDCTANFVFANGVERYLGVAAHCVARYVVPFQGCTTPAFPLGTKVTIDGASMPGELAYSSWGTMQRRGETAGQDRCLGNDFALIRIHPLDRDRVDPTMPFFGGPTGVASSTPVGAVLHSYGNSTTRPRDSALSPRSGWKVFGNAWTHHGYFLTPGVPGDSGSGFLNDAGEAVGVLSTIGALGNNGIADLHMALNYLREAEPTLAGLVLVPGGPFEARLPLQA